MISSQIKQTPPKRGLFDRSKRSGYCLAFTTACSTKTQQAQAHQGEGGRLRNYAVDLAGGAIVITEVVTHAETHALDIGGIETSNTGEGDGIETSVILLYGNSGSTLSDVAILITNPQGEVNAVLCHVRAVFKVQLDAVETAQVKAAAVSAEVGDGVLVSRSQTARAIVFPEGVELALIIDACGNPDIGISVQIGIVVDQNPGSPSAFAESVERQADAEPAISAVLQMTPVMIFLMFIY